MAFLRAGQYDEMVNHQRLVDAVKSLKPKPARNASAKEWRDWLHAMRQAESMSDEQLKKVIEAKP